MGDMNLMENIVTAITCKSAIDYIGLVESIAIQLKIEQRLEYYKMRQYDPKKDQSKIDAEQIVLFSNLPELELRILQEYFSKRIEETETFSKLIK